MLASKMFSQLKEIHFFTIIFLVSKMHNSFWKTVVLYIACDKEPKDSVAITVDHCKVAKDPDFQKTLSLNIVTCLFGCFH